VRRLRAIARLIALLAAMGSPAAGAGLAGTHVPGEDASALRRTMGGWSVRADPGMGIRLDRDGSGPSCHPADPSGPKTGFLPLSEPISAIATWGRTIYAASATEIFEIDARRPQAPVLARRVRLPSVDPAAGAAEPSPVLSLDALGSTLYLLKKEGLAIVDTSAMAGRLAAFYPDVRGQRIQVSGRQLRVTKADGSAAVFRDTRRTALRFDVAVIEDFFSPQNLVVEIGDEVRWSNASGTSHNIVSCGGEEDGCKGATSTEVFDSGAPELFFVYDHVFTQAGANPYFCEPHPYMTGSVTVLGASGDPPGVPDGVTGAPMTVQRIAADGSALSVSWAAQTCAGASDHEILYGYPYGLPPATGGGYEPAGSRCAIGPTSPFAWTGVPPAFPGASGLLWWIVVATDGAATEGSWGNASSGLERQGPGPGGASQECGIVAKSTANPCGH